MTVLVIVFALVASPVAGAAGYTGLSAVSQATSGWRLVFHDEFNGDALETGRWKTAYPWGRDRRDLGELQRYIPEAFAFSDGSLQIIAEPSEREGYAYTSGLISSHASFAQEFGRFEIRARLPRGQGLWPAFWLLPVEGSWPPEIDVFEALGDDTETVYMTAHWGIGGGHQQRKATFTGPDFAADYHTFAVEWTQRNIAWFVDGIKRHEVRGKSPRGPMYLLANLAVGGEWPGTPDASTPFPAVFAIDYIRAYEAVPAPAAREHQRTETHLLDRRRSLGARRLRHGRSARAHPPRLRRLSRPYSLARSASSHAPNVSSPPRTQLCASVW